VKLVLQIALGIILAQVIMGAALMLASMVVVYSL
jgi:hypothetical protein